MNKRELVRLHKRLCKELGIEPAKVVFRQNNGRGHLATYFTGRNMIVVYADQMKDYRKTHDPRTVMAHETYYHYRAKKGWMSWDMKLGSVWKGQSWPRHAFKSYNSPTWEAGAIRYQKKIATREGWATV